MKLQSLDTNSFKISSFTLHAIATSLPGGALTVTRTTILPGDVTKDPFHNLQVEEQTGILKHYDITTELFL